MKEKIIISIIFMCAFEPKAKIQITPFEFGGNVIFVLKV